MSLLSAERYVAVLDPRGVILVRRRGRRSAPETVGIAECASIEGGAVWASAVDALGSLLGARKPRSGRSELMVVLSSQFVRFGLVPWSDAIDNPEELDAYARSCFDEIYGAVSRSWVLRLSAEAAGCARIGAGVDRDLLTRLQTLCAAAGVRLNGVQPYLMVAFNRLGAQLRHGDFVFVLVEPARNTLLVARKGRWVSIGSSTGVDTDEAVGALIERESELQAVVGEVMPPVYVHAPGRAHFAPPSGGDAVPVPLALEGAPTSDPLLAMAQVGGY